MVYSIHISSSKFLKKSLKDFKKNKTLKKLHCKSKKLSTYLKFKTYIKM